MTCQTCGDQPEVKNGDFTGPVIEINNPETLVLLRKVVISASLGDDTTIPPAIGKYRNVLLQYEANNNVYLYSSDGIPTKLESSVPQEVLDRIEALEEEDIRLGEAVDEVSQGLANEITDRGDADTALQGAIDSIAIKNAGAPTSATVGTVGQLLEDTVNGKLYICTAADPATSSYTWVEVGASSGGGITELTSADYNWPVTAPAGVALWWLPSGVYSFAQGVAVQPSRSDSALTSAPGLAIVRDETTYKHITLVRGEIYSEDAGCENLVSYSVRTADGARQAVYRNITTGDVVNDLTSTEADLPLSAVQGKVLKGLIDGNLGKARVLTTDDYNWPTNNPTSVALWKLPTGIYSNSGSVNITFSLGGTPSALDGVFFIDTDVNSKTEIIHLYAGGTSGFYVLDSGGSMSEEYRFKIENNLTSTSTVRALSANQGKVLKDLIDSIAIRGAGAPTTSTVGEVGQLYEDGTNGALYQLKSIDITVTPNTYNWEEVGAGDVKAVYLTPTNVTSTTISVTADKTVAEIKGWADADKEVLFLIKLTQGFGGFAAGVYCFRLAAAHTDLVRAYAVDPTTGGVWTYLQNSNDGYSATVTIGAGAPTVVQTTGTSTTDVMSQNAVTSMVYADPSTKKKIVIPSGTASVGTNGDIIIGAGQVLGSGLGVGIGTELYSFATGGMALGYMAKTEASAAYSVALGAGAKATRREVNVGTGTSSWGYNNTTYRLIGGVHDGIDAHDAATYGQVISYSAINGAGAPTTATEGKYVGQLYYDTTNEAMYFLKTIDTTTTPATYTWEALGGGSSVNVVQTTGTSTTDVMSQNAVTSMVFADPSTRQRVQIGASSLAQGESVAIGDMANSSGTYAVTMGYAATTGMTGAIALGANSLANSVGEMNIGSTNTRYGYNNSNYRLLSGVYDPQSAHDAATKGYVDGTTEAYAIATSDWSALSASSPYDYQATVTATYTIGANTIAELLNDSPVEFATHGFAIGSISSQSVTIYSIGQPSASVSLKVNYKG